MEEVREIFRTSLKKANYPPPGYGRESYIKNLKLSAKNMETEKIFYFQNFDEGKAVAKMLIDENFGIRTFTKEKKWMSGGCNYFCVIVSWNK